MRKITNLFIYKFKTYLSFVKRFFIKPKIKKSSDGKVLVHIGCGEIDNPEYVNIDARPFAHVHYVSNDISNLHFLDNNSVDLIYMCHTLEHIERNKLPIVLKELTRVLKKAGALRISVPNFDTMVDIYNNNEKNIDKIINPLMGGQDYEYNFHYNAFNLQRLSKILTENGFSSINNWDPLNCKYYDFDDWAGRELLVDGKKYKISLNVEAVK